MELGSRHPRVAFALLQRDLAAVTLTGAPDARPPGPILHKNVQWEECGTGLRWSGLAASPPMAAWLPVLSPRDRCDVHVARCALGLQSLAPTGVEPLEIDPGEHRIGDHHLFCLGGVADAGGDIDVHTDVVASELARATPVN